MTRTGAPILRNRTGKLKQWVMNRVRAALPGLFAAFRRLWPIAKIGSVHVVTLHDDVREVLLTDKAFKVPYAKKLVVLMEGHEAFIGMQDTDAYRSQLGRLESLARPEDMDWLADATEQRAEAIVAASGGRLEVVDTLFRTVTFDILEDYFGVTKPEIGDMRIWSTRMFEYQFLGSDESLYEEIEWMAPALLRHIEDIIEKRRASGDFSQKDLLGRALALQQQGEKGWDDLFIRTMLSALVIGGPPQPPMVLPQALEQLLRRPDALASAQKAAREPDEALTFGHIFEALRFDPISPILPREATCDCVIAQGTKRSHKVAKGDKVLAAIQSAMSDPRRIPSPGSFIPTRQPHEYLHFGLGLHECFGRHINRAMFPAICAPLLRRKNLRRAKRPAGKLAYEGFFPASLTVVFDKD
ncbi:cytochrome P450 [Qipengyuania sp. 1NDH17]|uniref:Cytochrome P450 n=1 Tax=Qipengyuania polymorpha TaxID=2867234 RepID=A0ABS7J0J2_9SPHN|nr:cytochrome P450 [Qipengyuania polymorpha]MBX7458247.1 cytochrome P450 [Qipengyuania polymorpha]